MQYIIHSLVVSRESQVVRSTYYHFSLFIFHYLCASRKSGIASCYANLFFTFHYSFFILVYVDYTLLNKEPNVQVSDTTDDDSSNADDEQKVKNEKAKTKNEKCFIVLKVHPLITYFSFFTFIF